MKGAGENNGRPTGPCGVSWLYRYAKRFGQTHVAVCCGMDAGRLTPALNNGLEWPGYGRRVVIAANLPLWLPGLSVPETAPESAVLSCAKAADTATTSRTRAAR